jgi:hypothetical protein
MSDLSHAIQKILKNRKNTLPKIKQEIDTWLRLQDEIENLENAISGVVNYKHTPQETKGRLSSVNLHETKKDIAEVVRLLRIVESRFSRDTINIGVSGVARVGKSTLLQSISGLKDEEIPTGKGDPVTAVRSRIFHSNSNYQATLSLHTFNSFCDHVLRPYLNELEIFDIPRSVSEFKLQQFPQSESELSSHLRVHSNSTLLGRLLLMQKSIDSYAHLLTGGEKVVPLGELRPYIAYPLREEDPRPYLAVKDVKIECTFPRVQVESLGIVDLPGLGEVAADAEEYHLGGLQNEVDLVVLVKRPLEGMAYWKDEDKKTANLLDKARGSIQQRRDFVFVLVNSGGTDPQLCSSLKRSILNLANEQQHEKNFRILEADASDQVEVERQVLVPLLEHLSTRLPVMDQEVFDGARNNYTGLQKKIVQSLNDCKSVFRSVTLEDESEIFDEEFEKMYGNVSIGLRNVLEAIKLKKDLDENESYLAKLNDLYHDTLKWIRNGFDEGREEWIKNATRRISEKRGSAGFEEDQLNIIRVGIGNKYSGFDEYFDAEINSLLDQVASVFKKEIGDMVGVGHGKDTLEYLKSMMEGTSEPCNTLVTSISNILEIKIDFRAHLLPYVRNSLNTLQVQREVNDGTVETIVSGTFGSNSVGVESLFKEMLNIAEKTAYNTKTALLEEERMLATAKILYVALEHFDDTFIRGKNSKKEMKRFARAYKHEIWPSIFKDIETTNAHYSKLNKSIEAILKQLNSISQ